MIEKLKTINPYDETEIDMDIGSVGNLVYENTPLIQKLNEVIDAVNEIMTWRFETDDESPAENVQNKFAEQRKWIGCLCRFRQGLGVIPTYGILSKILPNSDFPYYKKDTDTYWKYCEPVKPDDDIIYKGEQDDNL